MEPSYILVGAGERDQGPACHIKFREHSHFSGLECSENDQRQPLVQAIYTCMRKPYCLRLKCLIEKYVCLKGFSTTAKSNTILKSLSLRHTMGV